MCSLEMLTKKAEKVQKSKGPRDPVQTALSLGPLGLALRDDTSLNPTTSPAGSSSLASRVGTYSKEEIQVLKLASSHIIVEEDIFVKSKTLTNL